MVTAPADTAAWENVQCSESARNRHSMSQRKAENVDSKSAPYFGVACHLVDRVMDVHGILDHSAVLVHLNFLGDAGDSEVITVTVKFNAAEGREGGGVDKTPFPISYSFSHYYRTCT